MPIREKPWNRRNLAPGCQWRCILPGPPPPKSP